MWFYSSIVMHTTDPVRIQGAETIDFIDLSAEIDPVSVRLALERTLSGRYDKWFRYYGC